MYKLLKNIYKYVISLKVRSKGVHISTKVSFNDKTFFEGTNVVNSGTWISNSYIGYGTYIGSRTSLPNCQIGKFCSIAQNVKVINATHPTDIFVSTSPMFFSTLKQNGKTFCEKNRFEEFLTTNGRNLIIGNDVWIGENVVLKGGITIGDGVIIAMGAVVTKDVPPYAIVGGVPAKIIRYRFNEEQIKKLLEIKWWNYPEEWIKNHSGLFDNVDNFINELEYENSTCNNSCQL